MAKENQTDDTSAITKEQPKPVGLPLSADGNKNTPLNAALESDMTVMADNLAFAQDLLASWQGASFKQFGDILLLALPVGGHVIGSEPRNNGHVFTIDGKAIV